MQNQFSRSELMLGKESTKLLSKAKIALFGLGGVGGYALEALARMGVGTIHIIDSDTVDITNLNRQIIALSSTVGQNKTDAFEKRIKDINPSCKVEKFNMFYLPENADVFDFASYDYVIDAIDTVTSKIDIIKRCTLSGTKVISSMGTGNKLDPTMLKVSDIYDTKVCPLARVMRYELKKLGVPSLKVVYSEEKPVPPDSEALEEYIKDNPEREGRVAPGSTSFVPSVAGLIIASEVIKDLISKGVEKDI